MRNFLPYFDIDQKISDTKDIENTFDINNGENIDGNIEDIVYVTKSWKCSL